MTTIVVRVNKPLGRRAKVGDRVTIRTDAHGTPLDQFWRRRLRDAQRDQCVTVEKGKAPGSADPATSSSSKSSKGRE